MGEWVAALWVHWVTLMSGVVSLLVGLWYRFGPSRRDLTNRAFIGVGAACIMLASYQAWMDEHQALLAERVLHSPRLEIELLEASLFSKLDDPNSTGILLIANLNNRGAPSVASHWELDVEIPNNPMLKADLGYMKTDEIRMQRFPGDPEMRQLFASDLLYDKAGSNPIPTGGSVTGWLLFFLDGIPYHKSEHPSSVLTLRFQDIAGHVYTVRKPLGPFMKKPVTYPGLQRRAPFGQ